MIDAESLKFKRSGFLRIICYVLKSESIKKKKVRNKKLMRDEELRDTQARRLTHIVLHYWTRKLLVTCCRRWISLILIDEFHALGKSNSKNHEKLICLEQLCRRCKIRQSLYAETEANVAQSNELCPRAVFTRLVPKNVARVEAITIKTTQRTP